MPCIMVRGRGQLRTSCTLSGSLSIFRLSPLPWESLITISVAPASCAASQAATTVSVIQSRARSYSKPSGLVWSRVTTPTMPSISAEM